MPDWIPTLLQAFSWLGKQISTVKVMLLIVLFGLSLFAVPDVLWTEFESHTFPYGGCVFLFACCFLVVHICSRVDSRLRRYFYVRYVMNSLDPSEKALLRLFRDQRTSTLKIRIEEHPAVLSLRDRRVVAPLAGGIHGDFLVVSLYDAFRKAVLEMPD